MQKLIKVQELGVVDYLSAWQMHKQIADRVLTGKIENTLLLLQHPSVYTAGRRTQLSDRPLDNTPVIDVDRGGKITWHGIGQLVGYPIIKLKNSADVVGFVRELENALIQVCEEFGITAQRYCERSGVWVRDEKGDRKIAAIGLRVAKIRNQVGVADAGCHLQRAFGADQLASGHPVRTEEGAGEQRIFCGHAQRAARVRCVLRQAGHILHRRPFLRHSQLQAALPKAQRIMQRYHRAVFAAVLVNAVQPGDAKVQAAAAHTRHNVPGALKQNIQRGDGREAGLILARVGLDHAQTAALQKIEACGFEAALAGQAQADVGALHNCS